jgi:hypothetical protein
MISHFVLNFAGRQKVVRHMTSNTTTQMLLTRVQVSNFKSFREQEVSFLPQGMNCITGPNGFGTMHVVTRASAISPNVLRQASRIYSTPYPSL